MFLAVARGQSVSRAAAELAMSQSAVSGSLAALERQFDIQLFDRIGKRLQLSTLGRALRPRAEALLEQANALEHRLQSRSAAGYLRVGATLTIGNYVVVPMMARFMREHPGARIELEVANTEAIVRKVLNFEIDVGLIEGQVQGPDLELIPWCSDALVVFCAPSHPYAALTALTDEHLRAASWVARERGSGTRQAFEHAMHDLLPDLQIALELQHTEAIRRAVEAGLGVACVSCLAVEDDLRSGRLVSCPVPHRDLRRQFHFVLHRDKFRAAVMQHWLDLCQRMGPELTDLSNVAGGL